MALTPPTVLAWSVQCGRASFQLDGVDRHLVSLTGEIRDSIIDADSNYQRNRRRLDDRP